MVRAVAHGIAESKRYAVTDHQPPQRNVMNCDDTYSVEFAIIVFDEKRAKLGEELGNG